MRRTLVSLLLPLVVSALVAGCGSDDPTPAPAPDASPGAPDTATAPPDAHDGADTDTDAAEEDTEPAPPRERPTARSCFAPFAVDGFEGPDYDQFSPVVGFHCLGTDHQDIRDVEQVVFFGDSVTVGTPPTPPDEYFRIQLEEPLRERFGAAVEFRNFAVFGARTDDLLRPTRQQFLRAFPEPDPRRTLAIMTIGGNDLYAWLERHNQGRAHEEIMEMVDQAIVDMEDAIRWLVDPERFPNGIYVIFANAYEYTDGSALAQECPLVAALGLTEPWPAGQEALFRFNEAFMRLAVETGTDMLFLSERFCGHGFLRGRPEARCDRGPDAIAFFDDTCIHPTPEGHAAITEMVLAVVDE
jgi:lysophospholipase L1-like esterase